MSPSLNFGCFDARTLPAPPARITSPIATGLMYERPSFIHPRIAGSSERYCTFTRSSPSPGSGTASSVNCQSLLLGMPTGRAARRTCLLVSDTIFLPPQLVLADGVAVDLVRAVGETQR